MATKLIPGWSDAFKAYDRATDHLKKNPNTDIPFVLLLLMLSVSASIDLDPAIVNYDLRFLTPLVTILCAIAFGSQYRLHLIIGTTPLLLSIEGVTIGPISFAFGSIGLYFTNLLLHSFVSSSSYRRRILDSRFASPRFLLFIFVGLFAYPNLDLSGTGFLLSGNFLLDPTVYLVLTYFLLGASNVDPRFALKILITLFAVSFLLQATSESDLPGSDLFFRYVLKLTYAELPVIILLFGATFIGAAFRQWCSNATSNWQSPIFLGVSLMALICVSTIHFSFSIARDQDRSSPTVEVSTAGDIPEVDVSQPSNAESSGNSNVQVDSSPVDEQQSVTLTVGNNDDLTITIQSDLGVRTGPQDDQTPSDEDATVQEPTVDEPPEIIEDSISFKISFASKLSLVAPLLICLLLFLFGLRVSQIEIWVGFFMWFFLLSAIQLGLANGWYTSELVDAGNSSQGFSFRQPVPLIDFGSVRLHELGNPIGLDYLFAVFGYALSDIRKRSKGGTLPERLFILGKIAPSRTCMIVIGAAFVLYTVCVLLNFGLTLVLFLSGYEALMLAN